jgi:hypothetical protein
MGFNSAFKELKPEWTRNNVDGDGDGDCDDDDNDDNDDDDDDDLVGERIKCYRYTKM